VVLFTVQILTRIGKYACFKIWRISPQTVYKSKISLCLKTETLSYQIFTFAVYA